MVDRIKLDPQDRRRASLFKTRPEGSGRKRGTANKTTSILKDAIILAAEQLGEIGAKEKGKDGLVGYLRWIARRYPEEYVKLLAKVLPVQLTGPDGGAITHKHILSVEEARKQLFERGIPISGVFDGPAELIEPPRKQISNGHSNGSNGHA